MSFAKTFKALSDPVRREILNLIKDGKMTAGDISSKFEISSATISYHLSLLKDANLVYEEKEKNYIYYGINTSVFEDILVWIKELGETKNENEKK